MSQSDKRSDNRFNTILTSVVGQVGCLTPIIIIGALFAGLWLDQQFETKPLFTIIFIVGSAPVSVYVLYRIVRTATAKLKIENQEIKTEEDLDSE
jgi:F0F1-type ATP synthase assembly protein I